MRVRSYAVVERHEAVWIWMGASLPDTSLLPSLNFINETPESAKSFGYLDTAANYELLTDNILDLSHAEYLHLNSLGGIMTDAKASMQQEGDEFVIQWISNDCVPPPAFMSMVPPPARADIWTEVRWSAPALMVLGTGANVAGEPRDPRKEAITLHNMTPASYGRTQYFFCSTRKFNVADAEFNTMLSGLITAAFEEEDKPMLEKQQRVMGTAEFWSLKPVLLGIDTGAVTVRRMLAKKIERKRSNAVGVRLTAATS